MEGFSYAVSVVIDVKTDDTFPFKNVQHDNNEAISSTMSLQLQNRKLRNITFSRQKFRRVALIAPR